MITSGQRRKRKWLVSSGPTRRSGGRLSVTSTSVVETGIFLPARMKNGTPSQRQESTCRRTAAKVSTVESGATPSSSR